MVKVTLMERKQTNILSPCRCGSYPIGSTVNAIPKGEGIVVFAEDGASQTFDGCDCRFGCTGRDYVNLTPKKFLSLGRLDQLISQIQGMGIHHPEF
jgi:hypothetical protein